MFLYHFIELTDENIEGVFKAAHLFQYENICRHIAEELKVSPENCTAMLKIAETHSLCELNSKALNYLKQFFSNVIFILTHNNHMLLIFIIII